MATTILDCYTDEPAGLGVPPYLGTYPRYIYGSLMKEKEEVNYLTVDDLRFFARYNGIKAETKATEKTNIFIYNTTKSYPEIRKILDETKTLIVILGVHVPGKYLSAIPGTLSEIILYIKDLRCRKILTGPAATEFGSQQYGGKIGNNPNKAKHIQEQDIFDDIMPELEKDYDNIAEFAVLGASIVKEIPCLRIAEIETGRGCTRNPGCSFCTEPLKNKLEFREQKDIIAEVKALSKNGIKNFRLGKQSCFYSYKYNCNNDREKEIEKLLKPISVLKPDVLHIDNANPVMVTEGITKLIVKYCTPGNIAAFGVESFDPLVQKKNNLNCTNEVVYDAVKMINKYGAARGANGMPLFLPGINILFGLNGESKETFEHDHLWLKKFLDEGLLVRRINIRQVSVFPGTALYSEAGNKFVKKNKRHYWKWRDRIRQDVDYLMLKKIVPIGTVLNGVRAEVYDGNNTFARQIGTYPLIVGVKERLKLGEYYSLKITGHMLRSITGEVVF
jgi:radical SAM superfamily enzyme with C-terminal helix-hairpin-helix motif